MSATLTQQFSEVVKAPLPIAILLLALAGIIWRIFQWRYDAIIDGLRHRVELRDDTIKRYEREGPLVERGSADSPTAKATEFGSASASVIHKTINADLRKIDSNYSSDRQYVSPSVSLPDLRGVYEGRTSIQAEKLASIYVGKWMNATGRVRAVYAVNERQTRLRIIDQDIDAVGMRGAWLSFNTNRDFLETLKEGDVISAVGKIQSLSQFDVEMVECELLE